MHIETPGFRFTTAYSDEGDRARLFGRWERFQNDAEIAQGQEYSLRFWSNGGPVTIGAAATELRAWDADLPPTSARIAAGSAGRFGGVGGLGGAGGFGGAGGGPNLGDWPQWPGDTCGTWDGMPKGMGPIDPSGGAPIGTGGGGVTQLAITIQLYAPGVVAPVQTWELPHGLAGSARFVTFNPQGYPTPDAPIKRAGWWRCTMVCTENIAAVYLSAQASFSVVPFRTASISTRLFRNVFRVALEVLVPEAHLIGGNVTVTAGQELAADYDTPPVNVTGSLPGPLEGHAKLRSLDITAVSADMANALGGKRGRQIHVSADRPVSADDVAIRIQAGFTDSTISAFGIDLARLDGDFGQVFLVFDKKLRFCVPLADMRVDFSTVSSVFLPVVNVFTKVDSNLVNDKIESYILGDNQAKIIAYLRAVLGRAVAPTGVVDEMSFGSNAVRLRYFVEPAELPSPDAAWFIPAPPHTPPAPGTSVSGVGLGGGRLSEVGADRVDGSSTGPTTSDALGVFPAGFMVATDNQALELLDRHTSIVFVMMENRSFDHLLGGLATARPRAANDPNRYDGPSASAANPQTDGFAKVPVVKTTAINMGTVTPVCPHHDYEPTGFQIRDGVHTRTEDLDGNLGLAGMMQGFTRSVADRTDSPQIVMMTYGEVQLPTYYALADDFKVCNRWFAAHPGPTWPNRYATVTGHIPALDNFPSNDPRIGYLQDHSIWDTLTAAGIQWRVFESDLSLIRTFDRYRLDDAHVIRFDDPDGGFAATLQAPAALPRVMFVEPNFTDLPPLAKACDDLAPADLTHGQAFIKSVYDLIRLSGRSNECLLVVTYDEHGGFYDHVAPPGTARGDAEFPDYATGIAPLIDGGPTHFGVRVPAFVVSPYVSAGMVSNTVFDHTSVLKTILVHNRNQLHTSDFASFGPRVAKATHLGVALEDVGAPRTWPDLAARQPNRTGGRHVPHPGDAVEVSGASGAAVSRAAVAPQPVLLTADNPNADPFAERGQFHSGLRDMLRPRRWMPPG